MIGLRSLKLAQGGAKARAEVARMVTEKIETGVTLQTLAMTGALGATPAAASANALARVRRKVRANRRRLAKARG